MELIEQLARANRRVVLTSDLLAVGVTEAEIARARRDGTLVRLIRGAYAVAPISEPLPILTAVAANRRYPRGAISCEFALAIHGCAIELPDAVHTTTPLPVPDGTDGVRVHGTRWPIPITHVDGVRAVSGAMALIGAWTDLRHLGDRRAVVCAALLANAATTAEVGALDPAAKRVPGAAELLKTCGYVDLGCESPLEIDYYVGIELTFHLPRPTGRQQWIELPDGRRRRVDVLYAGQRLIIEIDGGHHQLDEATRRRDQAMDAALERMGWRIRRFTRRDIAERPAWVAAEIRAELRSAA